MSKSNPVKPILTEEMLDACCDALFANPEESGAVDCLLCRESVFAPAAGVVVCFDCFARIKDRQMGLLECGVCGREMENGRCSICEDLAPEFDDEN